ncbi:nucleotidyl transferase family protein [Adhaeretor mobilis]|uniref:Nicotinate-nucleotide adenylyltransferase n=1 Tax=Adhaeretor mobilis TaxID=1930276 RepID=A0A517MRU0_9BACT|nr:hypothetical protein [Adhaeretor mobilis]QDS97602.1 nicotinate-nucleotide adenylyltransferase [Adhaeretor mobilis]
MEPTKPLDELWQPVVEAIHASKFQTVLAATGGSGALAALVKTPGASRTVLEAVVPYSHNSLCQWIGGTPDQACSEATARAMAMAAWMRARELAPEADPLKLLGLGCTASLATNRPKRGAHRVHVAVQSGAFTRTFHLELSSSRQRVEEETLAASLVISVLAEACEASHADLDEAMESSMGIGERISPKEQVATRRWSELILEDCQEMAVRAPEMDPDRIPSWPKLVFPGSFNPLHSGHLRMAEVAERKLGEPLAWELAINNVDKPPLDCLTHAERIAAIHAVDRDRFVKVSTLPTFVEKAEFNEEVCFVVGVDTLLRIADPNYYASEAATEEAIAMIEAAGCRFLVFGRVIDGKFQTLSDLTLPPTLLELCDEVTAEEFREDISSSELRS